MRFPTAVVLVHFLILFVAPSFVVAQQTDRKPIATLDIQVEKLLELLPAERPEEVETQVKALRKTGLQSMRIAILPDEKRLIVPVIKITGDMAKLNASLKDPNSPLNLIATPVGDQGFYQFPTSEKDPLQLFLFKQETMMVFAPADLDRGSATNSVAAAAMALKPEYALMIDIQFPEELNSNWLKPLLKQNSGVMGTEVEGTNADMGINMMQGMINSILRSFQGTSRITAAVSSLPNGQHAVDWHQVYRHATLAQQAVDGFNQKTKARQRLAKGVAKLVETADSSEATLDGNKAKVKLVWAPEKDEQMAQAFAWNIMGAFTSGPVPSAEPVATTETVPVLDFSQPYDSEKLLSDLKKAIPANVWSFGTSGVELDPLRIPNAVMAMATFEPTSLTNAEGVDVLRPKTEGQPLRKIRLGTSESSTMHFDAVDGERKFSKAKGRINIQVPEQVFFIKIPPGAKSSTSFPAGNGSLTVDLMENDVVSLSVDRGFLGPVQAFDAEGLSLRSTSSRYDEASKSIRYKGSVDRVEVMVLSQKVRDVSIDFEVSLDRENAWDGRERLAASRDIPKTYQPLAASDFENLEVVYKPKEGTASAFLELPIDKPDTDFRVSFDVKGFTDQVVEIRNREHLGNNKEALTDHSGLIYGSASVSGSVGSQYIEVAKGDQDGSVTFEVNGQSGQVAFERNNAKIVKQPGSMKAKIVSYLNAEGLPLRYDQFYVKGCFGVPTKVRIRVIEKTVRKTIPFEFETGPYDKQARLANKFDQYIQPSTEPVPTVGYLEPLNLGQPYQPAQFAETLKQKLPNYISFQSFRKSTHGPHALFEITNLKFADGEYVTAATEVLTASNADGEDILRTEGELAIPNGLKQSALNAGSKWAAVNFKAEKGNPEKARLKFRCEIPQQKEMIVIPASVASAEPGKTFSAGGSTLTCDFMKNDVVELTVKNGKLGQVQALDKDGRALRINTSVPPKRARRTGSAFRYYGTIDQLQVVVLSEKTEVVEFETDVLFDKKAYEDRDRYHDRGYLPIAYTSVPAGAFENLKVAFEAQDSEKGIYEDQLVFGFPYKFPDATITVTAHGIDGAAPKKLWTDVSQDELTVKLRGLPKTTGLIFGEIKITGRTGGHLIDVKKTADGEPVPFEFDGKEGEVVFDGKSAKITRYPAGTLCKIRIFRNAEGLALVKTNSYADTALGTPVSVQVYATTGREDVVLPFEFDLGRPYDKASLAKYKQELAAKGNPTQNAQPTFEPSPDPVATTDPAKNETGLEPYDPSALKSQLAEEIKQQIWFNNLSARDGKGKAIAWIHDLQSASPFARFIKASFEPTSALTAAGEEILATPEEPNGKATPRRYGVLTSNVYLNFGYEEAKGPPVKGSGTIDLKMPVHGEVIAVSKTVRFPKTYLCGVGELTVHRLENDIVHFTTEGGEAPVIRAFDKDGNLLKQNLLEADLKSRTSYGKAAYYHRVHGQIDRLEILVLAGKTVDVPIDIDCEFKKLEREEAIAQGRERYTTPVKRITPVTAKDFEGLKVTFGEKSRVLDLPFPVDSPNNQVTFKIHGLGADGPVLFNQPRVSRGKTSTYVDKKQLEKCSVFFGEATISANTNAKYIELQKPANGGAVPFTLPASGDAPEEAGEITFDENGVVFSKQPESRRCSISEILNSKGLPLLHVRGSNIWGTAEKVVLYTDAGKTERVIPFEFKLSEFDAAALAQLKKQHKVLEAAVSICKSDQLNYTTLNFIAGLYFLHDHSNQPKKSISLEVAQADPVGAKTFDYETKPLLGYYFVPCLKWEKTGQPVGYPGEPQKAKWDGGEIETQIGNIRSINAVPVDPTQPTFHFDISGRTVYAKTLPAPDEGKWYQSAPDVRDQSSGWETVYRWSR